MTSAIFPAYFLARMVVSRTVGALRGRRRRRHPRARVRAVPRRGAGRLSVGDALPVPDREGAHDPAAGVGDRRGGGDARRAVRARPARGPDPGLRARRALPALDERAGEALAADLVDVGLDRRDRARDRRRSSSSAPSSARSRRPGSSPPASTGTGRSSTGSGRRAPSRSASGCCRWSRSLSLVRPRGEQWTRELKAFVALTAASVIAFGLYTATKAAYLSTVFSTTVVERNLIYLAPLLFVATALALERGRLRWWAVAGTAGFVLYVILTTPYQLDLWPYSDALGLLDRADGEPRPRLRRPRRHLAARRRPDRLDRPALRAAIRRAPPAHAVLRGAVAAALVLSWNLAGEISASNGTNNFSQTLRSNFPSPPNWLDKATGGKPTIYLGQRITDPQGIWLMEFWNQSLDVRLEPRRHRAAARAPTRRASSPPTPGPTAT